MNKQRFEKFEDGNFRDKTDIVTSALREIEDKEKLYYISYAITNGSVAIGWSKDTIIETVEDYLLCKF